MADAIVCCALIAACGGAQHVAQPTIVVENAGAGPRRVVRYHFTAAAKGSCGPPDEQAYLHRVRGVAAARNPYDLSFHH